MPDLARLRITAGFNKIIPREYEEPILTALSRYPELKYTKIHFKKTKKSATPYGTQPSPNSFLRPPSRRKYIITLLENAEPPEQDVLFRNLPFEAQVAVIAHELVHVIQFSKCSIPELFRISVLYLFPSFRKRIERGADIGAIEHGFGNNLYKHAMYIRSIPGYVEERPEINKYYLRPEEILQRLRA
jgi:hypothetical protein